MIYLYVALVAFALGSIPFGYLVGRLVYRTDIRARGSGNIGAMNALRSLGKRGAAAVLVLDAAKGFAPAFLALRYFGDIAGSEAAAAAVLGHCFSPWLQFRGGKGVATSLGAIFALNAYAGLVVVLGWVAGALTTGYSSVGSIFGSLLAPIALYLFTANALPQTLYGVLAFVLVLFTHRENLGRLRRGTENPIRLRRADG
jgi:acyl phosphate:glycerol-3-phosphate acyltransferase